ncbi:MAG: helix-turn-helix domain-containing protein [Clostridia bacterium]|nr:helix-turn-helix domain-containing protein [Clostridia bacterium]
MILADKIIEERKKLGLSQEELAEKLSVSRQAVSKWESAQSIPDLQKIVMMSELFSVSTDYLLKDEMESEHTVGTESGSDKSVRRVSIEEANDYLKTVEKGSRTVALGVLLCILSPVLLIFLAGLAEAGIAGITETVACAIGLSVLFLCIAVAVFFFIGYGSRAERFSSLEKEEFETAYGVSGLVKEKKAKFEPVFTRFLSLGILLCVLSPMPLILGSLIDGSDVLSVSFTSLLLCFVACGVYMIVRVGMVKSSYNVLLQENAYTKDEKQKNKAADAFSGGSWCLATAVYLAWSFITNAWQSTWILWPVAAVLFVPFITIVKIICEKKD